MFVYPQIAAIGGTGFGLQFAAAHQNERYFCVVPLRASFRPLIDVAPDMGVSCQFYQEYVNIVHGKGSLQLKYGEFASIEDNAHLIPWIRKQGVD